MARYGFAIDIEKCTGCHNCFIACKDEHDGNDYPGITAAMPKDGADWISVRELEQGSDSKLKVDYIPVLCQICENAQCLKSALDGDIYRRGDGLVIIDPIKARGHKELVGACPYRAIFWNEEKMLPQKCTCCAHMLDNGEATTRCAECCPTGALIFGDLDDSDSEVSRLLADRARDVEIFQPQFEANPAVVYFGLPKPFIAGEVLLGDKPNECLPGAKITLRPVTGSDTPEADSADVIETRTDFFGDFEFSGLKLNAEYIVRAEYPGYKPYEVSVRVNAGKNLGALSLAK